MESEFRRYWAEHVSQEMNDPELEKLYKKAAAAPHEITNSERRRILRRPTVEIEAANVAEVTNGTLTAEQLIAKAANQAQALTLQECELLSSSFNIFDSIDDKLNWSEAALNQSDPMMLAYGEAEFALLSMDEQKAINNVLRVHSIRVSEKHAADVEQEKIEASKPPLWVQQLQESGSAWGFACMRSKESREGGASKYLPWLDYLQASKARWEVALADVKGHEDISSQMTPQWIDTKASETEPEEFRQAFRMARDVGHLEPGILKNTVILFVPEGEQAFHKLKDGAFESPWVWAYDPD